MRILSIFFPSKTVRRRLLNNSLRGNDSFSLGEGEEMLYLKKEPIEFHLWASPTSWLPLQTGGASAALPQAALPRSSSTLSAVLGTKLSLHQPRFGSKETFASQPNSDRFPLSHASICLWQTQVAQLSWDSHFCPAALLHAYHFAAFFLFVKCG